MWFQHTTKYFCMVIRLQAPPSLRPQRQPLQEAELSCPRDPQLGADDCMLRHAPAVTAVRAVPSRAGWHYSGRLSTALRLQRSSQRELTLTLHLRHKRKITAPTILQQDVSMEAYPEAQAALELPCAHPGA